ncbi:MAG: aspartate aminotransferase family protein [Candidatus Kaelpia aquatica]|nr:aspartate aminotransferase family protein [Candidatus Kaelpia aquatica]
MKNKDVERLYSKYIMNTYTHLPISLVKGRGSRVWDLEQNEYLDLFPGWGVSILGHSPSKVVSHVRNQAGKIMHISNNYYNHLQAKLAQKIVKIAQIDAKVFFCNSGAEANEGAFKLARLYGSGKRYKIITMNGSFHGRTLATLSATGQGKYKKGFEPMLTGFTHVPFNDFEVLKSSVDDETVAIMLELVQGEGGVNVADYDYIQRIKKFCNERDVLFIADEVQTGMGRTGKWFAYQNFDIEPDIVTLAKGIGGGVPMGVVFAKDKVADCIKPGMHASTFGGSPIVCKAALAVIDTIMSKKLLNNVNNISKYFKDRLLDLKEKYDLIDNVRGLGFMVAMEVKDKGKEIFEGCLANRLLINLTQGNILRFLPALNISKKEIDKAIAILDEALEGVQQ